MEFITDWKEDALRRDLTINAMSLSLDGTLYDYFEGEKHLAERRILYVGDPHSRITEDYLRILRYFRFYGRIVSTEGGHDQDTLEAIRKLAGGLQRVSAERIWAEMSRILVGNQAPHLVRLMYELGVAEYISEYIVIVIRPSVFPFQDLPFSVARKFIHFHAIITCMLAFNGEKNVLGEK